MVFLLIGCAKFFVRQRTDVARFLVCFSGGECGRIMINGNLQMFRLSVYSSMGVKIFEGEVYPDSIKIIYAYDNRLGDYLLLFESNASRLVLRSMMNELAYGFELIDAGDGAGVSVPGRDYCVGFVCIRFVLDHYGVYQGRMLLKEGRILYGRNTLTIKRV